MPSNSVFMHSSYSLETASNVKQGTVMRGVQELIARPVVKSKRPLGAESL